MKTKYFIFAAAAALFAACSSDDGITPPSQGSEQSGDVPVAFDSYVNRATTRAGETGTITTEGTGSTTSLQTTGFGVFGFYTNAESYDNLTFTPNFMYNQKVKYASSAWGYTPIKYWPNEFGNNSLSEDMDKVSFFAYAPYVDVTPATGKLETTTGTPKEDTWGIVGMKRNNETGDPMVKYIASFYTDKQVDLLWGTVASGSTSWPLKNTSTNQTLTAGLPWLDVQHPSGTATAQKVNFDFKHSLAALNVTVDTKTDGTDLENPATNSKVFIRSVTFEGFDMKGALNLNNIEADKPLWYNFNCGTELNNGSEVTIQDGRKDGKEGITEATKENAFINPTFVQNTIWGTSLAAGVTATSGNLFCTSAAGTPASDAPIFVIPNEDKLKVTIEYDVLTADDKLAGKLNDGATPGSVVKNVITRYISIAQVNNAWGTPDGETSPLTLENGKKYTIALHLGLNSVQFDASVTGWDGNTNGGADLPHNTSTSEP